MFCISALLLPEHSPFRLLKRLLSDLKTFLGNTSEYIQAFEHAGAPGSKHSQTQDEQRTHINEQPPMVVLVIGHEGVVRD
jgi:hypothetical protein